MPHPVKKSQQTVELGEVECSVVDVDHSLTILVVLDMAPEHSAARHPLGAVFDEPDLRFAGRYLDRGAVELGGEVLLCIHHRVEQIEHRGVRHSPLGPV